jgi:hypothetical protein
MANPGRAVVEDDPMTGEKVPKTIFRENIPLVIPCIVFDIVNGLRASLDHAVYACAVSLNKSVDPKHVKFPFGDTYTEAANTFDRDGKGVPAGIRDFLLDFKPYKEGNEALWRLNKIRNQKIHRTLAPMGQLTSKFLIGTPYTPGEALHFMVQFRIPTSGTMKNLS